MSASLDADNSLSQARRRVSAVSLSRGVASATWPGSPGPIGAPHTTHSAHGDALRPMWRIGEDPLAGAPGQMALSKNIYTPIPGRDSTPISQFSASQPSALSSGMYADEAPVDFYPSEENVVQPTELLHVGIAQLHPLGLLARPRGAV